MLRLDICALASCLTHKKSPVRGAFLHSYNIEYLYRRVLQYLLMRFVLALMYG